MAGMTDQEKQELEALKAKENPTEEDKTKLETLTKKAESEANEKLTTLTQEQLISYIKSLRKESGDHRKAAETLQATLDKQKADAAESERKKAEEAGEFKTLYETSKTELGSLKAENEKLTAAIQGLIDIEVAGIPENLKTLMPETGGPLAQMEWLTKAKGSGLLSDKEGPGYRPPGGPGGIKTKADLKSNSEKAAYINKHGSAAYLKLPDRPPGQAA